MKLVGHQVEQWRPLASFVIEGSPQGYYTAGKVPNWKRKQKYHEYKKHVERSAIDQGVPELSATKDVPLLVHTRAYFENGVHPDPENVRKGIVDALFYNSKTSDKHVGGAHCPPLYDAERPRVEVSIEVPDHG